MDTFKEKQMLDDMYGKGDTPWEVWKEKELTKVSVTA
jgi:glucose-1-phosphate cytidylyltransferase